MAKTNPLGTQPALTPQQQYDQVANNRSQADKDFYAARDAQIQGQQGAVGTAPATTLPTGAQIDSALAGTPPSVPNPAGGSQAANAPGPDPFAAMGGGVLVNGGWVPVGHPAAAGQAAQQAAAGTPGGPGSMGQAMVGNAPQSAPTDLMGALQAILARGEGGGLSQDIINPRIESARENLDRYGKSRSEGLQAQLSERGLLGSGAEATGMMGLEEELAQIFGGNVRDIYADEGRAADQRLMQALGILGGRENQLTQSGTQRDLGFANIESDYNLGQGRLGLDRELGLLNAQQGQQDSLMQFLQLMLGGAGQAREGYQK